MKEIKNVVCPVCEKPNGEPICKNCGADLKVYGEFTDYKEGKTWIYVGKKLAEKLK